ncbi:recombinase [Elizabethkingia anophelis]|nr:recombinase [Elizabethkingia anophelis]
MSNELTTQNLFKQKSIQERFEKLLGKKAQGFISSVLQIINGNNLLMSANPQTVLNAAATAATLDLPLDQNLGFSYIVPFKGQAQFQLGWKGFVQLAQRSGQFHRINVIEVYENQFKSFNKLTEELNANFDVDGEGKVVGYVAYFRLINGFEKMSFWSIEKVKKHAAKYSQTYGKKNKSGQLIFSPWNDEDQFDAMAKKTVLKNTLSQYAPLSIEMQTAQLADQSVQNEEGNFEYVDNTKTIDTTTVDEEMKRIESFIEKADSIEKLEECAPYLSDYPELAGVYDSKEKQLKSKK